MKRMLENTVKETKELKWYIKEGSKRWTEKQKDIRHMENK